MGFPITAAMSSLPFALKFTHSRDLFQYISRLLHQIPLVFLQRCENLYLILCPDIVEPIFHCRIKRGNGCPTWGTYWRWRQALHACYRESQLLGR